MTNPTIIDVVCAVIIRDGRLFAAQRGKSKSQPLKWELPGGKVETGEDPALALQRELFEELHLSIHVKNPLPSNVHQYTETIAIRLLPYSADVEDISAVILHEHAQFAWVTAKEAELLDWTEADIPIVQSLIQNGFSEW